MNSLSQLYQRMTGGPRAAEPLDADALARLAAGQHLGPGHDAALSALAGSSLNATALRVALAQADAAQALARGVNGAEVVALPARRPAPAAVRWLAMAAGVAAVALVGTLALEPQGGLDTAQPAVATASQDDAIFDVSFEGAIVASEEVAPAMPAGDDIFIGEFDS